MAKDLSLSLASTAVGASTATTAGPAAAAAAVVPSPSSRYRSREDIYHNIELARVFCSNEEFAALLELNKTDWWKCLDYYKPPSNASRQQVLSGQVDLASLGVKLRNKHLKEFIPALSDFLLLDEHQCCDIFAAFVRREFMTLSSDLSLMDLELDDTLQNKIMNLYFEERWTTTLLLSAIIRASYNPDHPYYAELAVFVRENATDAFIAAILAQVVRAASTRVPTHVETSSHRAGVWAGQLLKEQKGLLDVLFMARYYDEAKPLAECTKIARIFAQISFGLDQPNSALFDRERQELWHSVVFMFCLVIVDSLDLESYLNPKKQKPVSKDDLRSLLQHMVPFVQSYSVSANSAIGFVLLAVGAFLQRISEDDGDGRNSSADFISRAFQLGALPYIQRRLELVAVTDTDETFLVGVKSVIKGLLTLCLETFSINNQEILNQFVACMVSIFKDSQAICEQFWIEDYPIAERRSLLDLTRARFPFVSSPLIQLLRSLTSPVTAAYVFRYSCSIPTAAVMASEEVLQKIAGNKFLLRTNLSISPYASPFHSVQASAGMEASTIAISPHVIQVNKPHSILHLLVTYCEAFLACELAGVDTPGSHINSLVHDLCNLMSLFNDLVANGDQNLTNQAVEEMCLAPSPSHRMGHADVIGLFTRVLSKCCLAQQVLSSLINACLRNLTLLIPTYSEEIWNYLRHESFLPRFTPSSGRFISPQDRFLQQMLFPVERSLGTYDTTLSFLDLLRVMISRCLESSSDWSQWVVDIDLLCPSVLFLHSEVFPTYNSWRYKIVMQKYEIGLKILDIFNLIMSDSTLPMSRLKDSRNPAAKLHELLTESYLNGSLFILSPLLDLLSTGTSFLNRLYRTQKMKEASAVEQTIVAALTFLKHLLAWRKRSGLQGTTLEHILLDRTVRNPESTEMTELIQVLGSYVSYSFNVVIPCLSVEVLTQLCSIASEWKPRAPSFVGFFEGTASQIVHRLIDIAASEGEESELHEELQVRVLLLITAIFQTQPALATIFLEPKDKKGKYPARRKSANGKTPSELSILDAIYHNIQKWKALNESNPKLLVCTLQLLETLFRMSPEYHTHLSRLKDMDGFWNYLLDILKSKNGAPPYVSMESEGVYTLACGTSSKCFILDILSHEVNFSQAVKLGTAKMVPVHLDQFLKYILTECVFSLKDVNRVPASSMNFSGPICRGGLGIDAFERIIWSESFDPLKFAGKYDVELLECKLLDGDQDPNSVLGAVTRLNDSIMFNSSQLLSINSICRVMQIASAKFEVSLWDVVATRDKALLSVLEASKTLLLVCPANEVDGIEVVGVAVQVSTALLHFSSVLDKCLEDAAINGVMVKTLTDLLVEIFSIIKAGHGLPRLPPVVAMLSNLQVFTTKSLPLIVKCAKSQKDEESIRRVLHACMSGLPLQISMIKKYWIESIPSDQYLFTSMAMVNQVFSFYVSVQKLIGDETWLQYLQKNDIVIALIQIFGMSVAASVQSEDGNEITLSELSLQCIQLLAANPYLAPLVVQSGLTSTFCTLPIAQGLSEGSLAPYQFTERSKLHSLWCQMLSVLSEAMLSYPSLKFVAATVGVLKLFGRQLENAVKALSLTVTIGQLEELESFTRIAHGLALACNQLPAADLAPYAGFLDAFFSAHMQLLEDAVYYLRHPGTLAQNTQIFAKDFKDNFNSNSYTTACESMLLSICRNSIATLIFTQNVEQVILRQPFNVFASLSGTIVRAASLSELLQCIIDRLSKSSSNSATSSLAATPALSVETLSLMASQVLALLVRMKASSDDAKRDIVDSIQQVRLAVEQRVQEQSGGGGGGGGAGGGGGGSKAAASTAAMMKQYLRDIREMEAFFAKFG